jgi:hypothetical protein
VLTAAVQFRRRSAQVDLSGDTLGLFEPVERVANIVKWTGIGLLALAGAVFVFKLGAVVAGD